MLSRFGFALLLALSFGAKASIPSADGTIHGCVDKKGALRVIDADVETCTAKETALAWNRPQPRHLMCGVGAATTGAAGGFPGMKARCVTACGSPDAHLCTAGEMSRSAQEGMLPASFQPYHMWISSAGWTWTLGPPFVPSESSAYYIQNECWGWQSSQGSAEGTGYVTYTEGPIWLTGMGESRTDTMSCSLSLPVACCL